MQKFLKDTQSHDKVSNDGESPGRLALDKEKGWITPDTFRENILISSSWKVKPWNSEVRHPVQGVHLYIKTILIAEIRPLFCALLNELTNFWHVCPTLGQWYTSNIFPSHGRQAILSADFFFSISVHSKTSTKYREKIYLSVYTILI